MYPSLFANPAIVAVFALGIFLLARSLDWSYIFNRFSPPVLAYTDVEFLLDNEEVSVERIVPDEEMPAHVEGFQVHTSDFFKCVEYFRGCENNVEMEKMRVNVHGFVGLAAYLRDGRVIGVNRPNGAHQDSTSLSNHESKAILTLRNHIHNLVLNQA